MAVIKGKEKKLDHVKKPNKHGMTAKAKKILRNPKDVQPIAATAVA
jgi:hypothetical protein